MNTILFSSIAIALLVLLLLGNIVLHMLKHENPFSATIHGLGYTAVTFLLLAILMHAPQWALLALTVLLAWAYQIKEQ